MLNILKVMRNMCNGCSIKVNVFNPRRYRHRYGLHTPERSKFYDENHLNTHRCSFCDELCQLYDVIYKTRCPTLYHTEHHKSSFIGNFHIFCHRNENDDGFVLFCGDLSFHWYIEHLK